MYRIPRGTQDILPEDQPYWRFLQGLIHRLCQLYGYQQINTPIFEETSLFVRGIGEGTDIVEKEMYTFKDKGGESLTLRPEGTAPVMRAYLEHGMWVLPKPVKLYYIVPIFRYERPQAGRYRQHYQFGVEVIGEQDPAVDLEVISIAWHLYREIGLKGVSIQLNSIGCPKCRPGYVKALVEYYRGHEGEICADCKVRLKRNPLRLLDCKNEGCQGIIEGAPRSIDHLCTDCRQHFETLRSYLDFMGLPYDLNHRLVRGLDYYTKTVFEFWAEGIGAQNALGGGGRYDGLIEELGGEPTPGIGFGLGMERIILTMKDQGIQVPELPSPKVFIAHRGEAAKRIGLKLLASLRAAGVGAVFAFGDRSLKAQMRQADRAGVDFTLILGEREIESGQVTVRAMAKGEQFEVGMDDVVDWLSQRVLKPIGERL